MNAADEDRHLYETRSSDINRTVSELIARNRVDALHTLAVALDAEADDLRIRLNRAENALHHVAFALASTSGEAYAETLLRLLPNRPFLYKRLRPLMAVLARNQSTGLLLSLLDRYLESNEYLQAVGEYYHLEMMSLLLHEAILRGVGVSDVPSVQRLVAKMTSRHHALSWLPLTLTDLETELRAIARERSLSTLPLPAPGAVPPTGEFPIPPAQPMLPLGLPPAVTPLPAVRETTRTLTNERLKVAASHWYNVEARTFRIETPISPRTVTSRFLESLDLESLEGAVQNTMQIEPVTPNYVLGALFAIAATGGPHEGYDGAYGRLYAWASLGALAGAAPDDDIETVRDLVKRCTWFAFEADTLWFHQMGWDLGIVALRPDGESLAVLAATASD